MAKKVKDFQFQRGGMVIADEWFDGDPWELTVDADGKGDVRNAKTAEQAFRKKCRERGLSARVSISPEALEGDGTMTIQAYPSNGEAAPRAKRKAKAK